MKTILSILTFLHFQWFFILDQYFNYFKGALQIKYLTMIDNCNILPWLITAIWISYIRVMSLLWFQSYAPFMISELCPFYFIRVMSLFMLSKLCPFYEYVIWILFKILHWNGKLCCNVFLFKIMCCWHRRQRGGKNADFDKNRMQVVLYLVKSHAEP